MNDNLGIYVKLHTIQLLR